MKRILILTVLVVMLLSIASVVFADKDGVDICHETSAGRYIVINVSNTSTLEGHIAHPNDIIPAPDEGCPGHHEDPH